MLPFTVHNVLISNRRDGGKTPLSNKERPLSLERQTNSTPRKKALRDGNSSTPSGKENSSSKTAIQSKKKDGIQSKNPILHCPQKPQTNICLNQKPLTLGQKRQDARLVEKPLTLGQKKQDARLVEKPLTLGQKKTDIPVASPLTRSHPKANKAPIQGQKQTKNAMHYRGHDKGKGKAADVLNKKMTEGGQSSLNSPSSLNSKFHFPFFFYSNPLYLNSAIPLVTISSLLWLDNLIDLSQLLHKLSIYDHLSNLNSLPSDSLNSLEVIEVLPLEIEKKEEEEVGNSTSIPILLAYLTFGLFVAYKAFR